MEKTMILVKIGFVIFITSVVNFFGADEDGCCGDCCGSLKDSQEIKTEENCGSESNYNKKSKDNDENNLDNLKRNVTTFNPPLSFSNNDWYDLKKKKENFLFLICYKIVDQENAYECKIDDNNIKFILEPKSSKFNVYCNGFDINDKFLNNQKWSFFDITYKITEGLYNIFLFCNDIESIMLDNGNFCGIFEYTAVYKIRVLCCDVSSIEYFDNMFHNCCFITEANLFYFNTSNVLSFRNMFYNCISLQNINIYFLDTNKVCSMNSMFYNCKCLSDIIVGRFFIFNFNIDVTNMFYMCDKISLLNKEIPQFTPQNIIIYFQTKNNFVYSE